MDLEKDPAWEALRQHGRAGVGRPRKDSQAPTLAQLGLSKWTARRAAALAGISDELMDAVCDKRVSVTAIVERHSRNAGPRQRNPLFRAWRVATKAERVAFLNVLQRLAFFAEREDALKG